MTNSLYNFRIAIDWADMDLFGHVNNVAYFRYVQAARVSLCKALGLDTEIKSSNGFIVVASICNFKQALLFPGEVLITYRILKTGTTSFTIVYQLRNENGLLCAEAQDTLVYYDHIRSLSLALSAELKDKLQGYAL